MKKRAFLFLNILIIVASTTSYSQNSQNTGYRFKTINEIPHTSVKNQYLSGTCWAYASISFIESEIIKNTGKSYDLSEMYIVRNVYPLKAEKYVRLQGNTTFGPGGEAHDVVNIIKTSGMCPEDAYNGLKIGEDKPNHGEMDAVLKAIVNAVIKKEGGDITPVWLDAFNSVLNIYLGEIPSSFKIDGKKYTPREFTKQVGINPDDYVELTSFTHHPFYQPFILEIPDNWDNGYYYNLPINELINVIDNALSNGYSVAWDGDVSEKGFSQKNGIAIVPQIPWKEMSENEKEAMFKKPGIEQTVNQEMRQKTFDNQSTTDDHLMHIIGLVNDQNGTKYYKTKNSWGTDNNDYGGYIHLSEAYVLLKTISIMVNKKAIPSDIANKLDIK